MNAQLCAMVIRSRVPCVCACPAVIVQVLRSPLLPPVDPAGTAAEGPATTTYESTLWGPTCDSADYLYKDVQLPELRNGDWLMFVNAGAYTVAGACDFNGIAMTQPNKFYVFSAQAVDEVEESSEEEEQDAAVEFEEEEQESEDDSEDGDSEEEEDEEAAQEHGCQEEEDEGGAECGAAAAAAAVATAPVV